MRAVYNIPQVAARNPDKLKCLRKIDLGNMIITNAIKVFNVSGLEQFKGNPQVYNKKKDWSRAFTFNVTEQNLKKVFNATPLFEGTIYDVNGEKTTDYQNFKEIKIFALWFVDGLQYRPSCQDYSHWDGHILLDLDKLSEIISDAVFKLLATNMPQWVELLKKSGSGSLHILCRTDVTEQQRDEQHFYEAFDTFSTLLNNLLNANGLMPIEPDKKCRNITQGMALWNTTYVLNTLNAGYDLFSSAEYKKVTLAQQQQSTTQKIAKAVVSNNITITTVNSDNYDFAYDTSNAVKKMWQPQGSPHPDYDHRFPVVVALKAMRVSEDETYNICSYGFEDKGLSEVSRYYKSAKVASCSCMEHNIKLMKEYLDACGIQYSIQPKLKLDPKIRPLNDVVYDETIQLKKGEYLFGKFLEKDRFLKILEQTDKGVVYLYAAPAIGKTEMAKQFMRRGKSVCFACGRNTVLEGKFRGMDVVRCYGQYTKNAEWKKNKKSVICSLDWLEKNWEGIKQGRFDFIIIDEIHLVGERFRSRTMLSLLERIEHINDSGKGKLILMTGTPNIETYYLPKDNTVRIKVDKPAGYAYELTPVVSPDYRSALEKMLTDVRECVGNGCKAFIVENDTKRNAVLTDYLANSGLKLVDFNRQNKSKEVVQHVIKDAGLPEEYDGIILTSYLGVGNEIKDNNEWRVFFMPTFYSNFTAEDIEQYAKRIRDKNLTARIYYYGVMLTRPILAAEDAAKQQNKLHKLFDELQNLNGNGWEELENLISISSEEDKYNLFVYQNLLYQKGARVVLSLLKNEYKWEIQDTEYNNLPSSDVLQESRSRVNEEERKMLKSAFLYMADILFDNPELTNNTRKHLSAISNGFVEYETEWEFEGDIFSLKTVKKYNWFNKYHRQIASAIVEFGYGVLYGYNSVVYHGDITYADLQRVINTQRIIEKIKKIWSSETNVNDKVEQLLNSVSEYLDEHKLPFNRNQLSAESKQELTKYIASLLPKDSTVLSACLAGLIILLAHRDSDGTMKLSFQSIRDGEMGIGECFRRIEEEKEERKRKQKRGSARRRRRV